MDKVNPTHRSDHKMQSSDTEASEGLELGLPNGNSKFSDANDQ